MTNTATTTDERNLSRVVILHADMSRLAEPQQRRLADLRDKVMTDLGSYDLGRLSERDREEWDQLVELLVERQESLEDLRQTRPQR